MSTLELDSLDALLSEARAEHKSRPQARSPRERDANYRACFTRPEFWRLDAQVTLIHSDGNVKTLVGLFNQLTHTYVPRCRRLTACTTKDEALPQLREEVEGHHWLPLKVWGFKREPVEQVLQLLLDLTLDMGQHLKAQAIHCEAHLVGGGLQRLCILEDAIFEGNTPRTILQLPSGLDVLEGLLGGCKVLVWKAINEELANGQP